MTNYKRPIQCVDLRESSSWGIAALKSGGSPANAVQKCCCSIYSN